MRDRIFAVVIVMLASGTAAADTRVHVVAAGESLELLARRYRTSAEALRELNGLASDLILVGQELTVDPAGAVRYTTVPGDTLSCIAERYGVSADRVRADNALRGRLEAGRTLVLRGARDPRGEDAASLVRHRVREGESLSRIARRYGVSLAEFVASNPSIDPDRLRAGAELLVRSRHGSASVGAATCGWIRGAVQLPRHRGYVLRDASRAWTTTRTVSRITAAFDALTRAHPRAPRVRVHDLSLRDGGPIDDHRSHQSGRDVDITYFQVRGCGASGCPLRAIDPEDLDVRRQWALLSHWLRRDEAEAIYVDYELQPALYREAERRGASRAELERWFQYPRGRSHQAGVIRHFPNHRDHVHVRFACDASEPRCR